MGVHMVEEQKVLLINYMREHSNFAAGKFLNAAGRQKAAEMWATLASLLNAVGNGAFKDPSAWASAWKDWKNKTRAKASKILTYQRGTGGGNKPPPPLTDIEERLVELIGEECVAGLPRVDEVGFGRREETLTPSAAPSDHDDLTFEGGVSVIEEREEVFMGDYYVLASHVSTSSGPVDSSSAAYEPTLNSSSTSSSHSAKLKAKGHSVAKRSYDDTMKNAADKFSAMEVEKIKETQKQTKQLERNAAAKERSASAAERQAAAAERRCEAAERSASAAERRAAAAERRCEAAERSASAAEKLAMIAEMSFNLKKKKTEGEI